MRRTIVQAFLAFSLLALAGCGSASSGSLAPPLVFPTTVPTPAGPPPPSVYLSSYSQGAGGTNSVSALDASDGTMRWQHSFQQTVNAPVLDSALVLVGAADGKVYALDAHTGTVSWQRQIGGFPEIVQVVSGVVYVGGDQEVNAQPVPTPIFALNIADGSVRWQSQIQGVALSVIDGVVYVGTTDQHLYALNVSDGSVRWQIGVDSFATVVYADSGQIYAISYRGGFGSNGVVYGLDPSKGTLKWRYPAQDEQPFLRVVAATNGSIYLMTTEASTPMFPTLVLGIDGATGAIRWHVDVTKPPASIFSGVFDTGSIYLGASDGSLYAIKASDGSARWHAKFGNIIPFVLDVDEGVVYVSGQNQGMGAINASDGSLRWKYEKLDGFLFIINIMDGLIYAGSLHPSFSNQGEHNFVFVLHTNDASTLWSKDVGLNSIFPIMG